jgi:hypothetical protein
MKAVPELDIDFRKRSLGYCIQDDVWISRSTEIPRTIFHETMNEAENKGRWCMGHGEGRAPLLPSRFVPLPRLWGSS